MHTKVCAWMWFIICNMSTVAMYSSVAGMDISSGIKKVCEYLENSTWSTCVNSNISQYKYILCTQNTV